MIIKGVTMSCNSDNGAAENSFIIAVETDQTAKSKVHKQGYTWLYLEATVVYLAIAAKFGPKMLMPRFNNHCSILLSILMTFLILTDYFDYLLFLWKTTSNETRVALPVRKQKLAYFYS